MKPLMLAAAAIASFAPPLHAQSESPDPGQARTPLPADRGYDKPSPRTDAINAPNEAKRAAANNAVAVQGAGTVQMNTAQQAQYQADMAAYRDALRAQRRTAIADAVAYDRQQRAYADAMFAWRVQVDDCRAGISAACNAPTPDPADFWMP